MTRAALLERLKELQRTPRFQNRDISTVRAILTKKALERHVQVCEEAVAQSQRAGAA